MIVQPAPAPPPTIHLRVAGPACDAMRTFVERDLGWPLVDDAGGASLVVTDGAAAADGRGPDEPGRVRVPVLLLVDERCAPAAAAASALQVGASAVVAWPSARDQLAETAQRLARVTVPDRAGVDVRLGGAAGGVGTTTVTLAIGGWLAWAGRAVLVLASGPVPAPAAGPAAAEDLMAATTWRAAAPAAGLPALRTIATTGPTHEVPVDAGGADVVLRDVGRATDVDVLVARRDRAGVAAVSATTAGVVVVVGEGPVTSRHLRAAAGGRTVLTLPWSARVARAAVAERVPAGLPGRWLQLLRPLATTLLHSLDAPAVAASRVEL